MSNYICPHCGKSDYYEQYTTATCMYSTPHYRDGVLVNDDPNYYTTFCRCAACGKEFIAQAHQGQVTVDPVLDSPEVPFNELSKKVDALIGSITI